MRLLAKYQPKITPNARTIYGKAAIGCCSHIGSPWGQINPIAMRKISPPGKRTARRDFQSRFSMACTCALWTITRDARDMRRKARSEVRRSGFEVPKTSNFGPRTLPRLARPAFHVRQSCGSVFLIPHTCEPSKFSRDIKGFLHPARGVPDPYQPVPA